MPKNRIYKIPDGKPENTFAFSGEAKNKKYATEIIHECHEAWRRLITGETPARTPNYDLSMSVLSDNIDFERNTEFLSTAKISPLPTHLVSLGGTIQFTLACLLTLGDLLLPLTLPVSLHLDSISLANTLLFFSLSLQVVLYLFRASLGSLNTIC